MPDWPQVLKEFGPMVWRSVYRLVGDSTDASDCFQETFLRALQVSRRTEVRSWPGLLQRIAVQTAINRIRQRSRKRARHQSDVNWESVGGREPDPADHVVGLELATQLREALAMLPEMQSTVFVLRQIHDMSYEQIAEVIGSEVGHVGVLLHRARRRLAEFLRVNGRCEQRCTHERRD